MQCSSDFECGNGRKFTQTAPHAWRMEVCADRAGYDHYFHFRIETEKESGIFEMIIAPEQLNFSRLG